MPIVAWSYEKSVQADGSYNVVEYLTDNSTPPFTHVNSFHAEANWDLDAVVAQRAADLSDQLATQEFERLISGG